MGARTAQCYSDHTTGWMTGESWFDFQQKSEPSFSKNIQTSAEAA